MTKRSNVRIDTRYGWSKHSNEETTLWIKGYVYGVPDLKRFFDGLMPSLIDFDSTRIEEILCKLDGNFGFVIQHRYGLLMAVDRIRSIPLFYVNRPEEVLVTDNPRAILQKLHKEEAAIDNGALLTLRMSGYCNGSGTLLSGLKQLQSGEYLTHSNQGATSVHSYYKYLSVPPAKTANRAALKRELERVTINIIDKLIRSANGRMIVVPLSGGYDSRVIASGLAHRGYQNVRCFSYGKKNNYESKISRAVAKQLGFKWKFVHLDHKVIRTDFRSLEHKDYISFADTLASVPVEHEYSAIRSLKESRWVARDAIFINGMSGDFLTGAHIPKAFVEGLQDLSEADRKKRILKSIVEKHYSLWDSLITQKNICLISDLLWRELVEEAGGLPKDSNSDFAFYEFSEFKNRQTKYVITVQRIYEFYGYEWRLPLWDKEYLDFWCKVPLEHKIDRNLFVEVMHEMDWGGVWMTNLPEPFISPRWIALLRVLIKPLFVMLGKNRWKKFDKRFFYYWTEILCKIAIIPYVTVVLDSRGFRNSVSWLTEDYVLKLRSVLNESTFLANPRFGRQPDTQSEYIKN